MKISLLHFYRNTNYILQIINIKLDEENSTDLLRQVPEICYRNIQSTKKNITEMNSSSSIKKNNHTVNNIVI
jgi:hypothetical protein